MRRRRRRGAPGPTFYKLAALLLATAAIAAWGRYGSIGGMLRAAAARFSGEDMTVTVPESAPPIPAAGETAQETAAESAGLFGRRDREAPKTEPVEEPYAPEVRNDTAFVLEEEAIPSGGIRLTAGDVPQVLIVHTHTSEAYAPDEIYSYEQDDNDRTLDPRFNVVAVGDLVEAQLEKAGIAVLHERAINDYPSYNGSYTRMLGVIEDYLAEYPSISVVLDIHRDAMIYPDGSRFAPRADIGGESTAQVMLVVGTDEGGLSHPGWRENLAFALAIQRRADELYPGLMRPVNLRASRFNQHVSPGALIVEVGSSGNTLGEALRGAELFTEALIGTILA